MRFAVGALVVDTDRLTLERHGDAVPVQPQVFDVLSHLVRHRDRVVTKEELLDEVWGDRFVSESALSSRIKSARQILGDDGSRQAVIKTFHGRGFRWVARIEVLDAAEPSANESPGGGPGTGRSSATPPPGLHTETLGRDDVVGEVTGTLATGRLVTLVGSPGIGKTRIALEAVRQLDREARDIAFVELHAAANRHDVLRLVRRAVGIDPERDVAATVDPSNDDLQRRLIDRLADAAMLILVDNCEHVADDVAALLRRLLPAAPSITVLATSRRPLWVDGEHLVMVGPLDRPANGSWTELAGSPSGQLFLERCRAAGVTWSADDGRAALVGELCRRLDGVPLAIELAAARARWMPLERLLDDLGDVSSDWSSGVQPLAASLRSSRMLLDDAGRAGFDALSIFAGPFSFDAALRAISAVAPGEDHVAVFEQLVDHSLVEVSDLGLGRYRMLEPVRQFAAAGEPHTEVVVPALIDFFTEIVERTWPTSTSNPAAPWDRLDADIGNVLLLIERATATDRPRCRRLVGSLGRWWWMANSTQRCLAICEQLGAPDGDDPAAAARYLWTWCMAESTLWRPPRERAQRAHQAHRLALDTGQWSVAASALSLAVAGDPVWADLETVEASWDEIESLYRRADDAAGEAWARVRVLGHAQACAGRTSDAADSFRTAVELYQRIGDPFGIATAAVRAAREAIWAAHDPELAEDALELLPVGADRLEEPVESMPYDLRAEAVWYWGRIAEARGAIDLGIERHRASVRICEADAPRSILTNTLRVHLAGALRRARRYGESAACLHEALEKALRWVVEVRPAHPLWVIEIVAGLLAELDRVEEAARLFGAAEAGRERLQATMPPWDRPGYEHDVALIAGSEAFTDVWAAGRELGIDQACRIGLAGCSDVMGRT